MGIWKEYSEEEKEKERKRKEHEAQNPLYELHFTEKGATLKIELVKREKKPDD